MIENHTHNGTDAAKVMYMDLIFPIPTVLTPTSGHTAGATYTTTEQALINELQARLNELEAVIQAQKLAK